MSMPKRRQITTIAENFLASGARILRISSTWNNEYSGTAFSLETCDIFEISPEAI